MQRGARAPPAGGEIPDVVLMLEHPPVYTKGRRSSPEELPMGEDWYRMQGIEVVQTDRGGQVTYHGPGQLVAYPIMSLRELARPDDVHEYVRLMERAMIAAIGDYGVEAGLIDGLTGRLGRLRAAARRRRAQDRLDRHPRAQGDHHARARGQRRQRPAAVRVGRPVRDRGLPDDLAHPRAGGRAVGRTGSPTRWPRGSARPTGASRSRPRRTPSSGH